MEYNIQIIHNENSNHLKLNIDFEIGHIQEEVLRFFNLIIYNIEYSIINIDNKEYILGIDELKFQNKLNEFLKNNDTNNIQYIKILDRKRDENDNVLKENLVIEEYNKWFQDRETRNYISYVNNSQNNQRSFENMLFGQIPYTRRIIRRYNLNHNIPTNIHTNIQSNQESNIETNQESNLETNIETNLEPNLETNQEPNLEPNLETNEEPNEETNLETNQEHNEGNNEVNDLNNQNIIRNNMNNLIDTFFDDITNISPINNNNFLNIINNNIQERINNINNNNSTTNDENLIEIDYQNNNDNEVIENEINNETNDIIDNNEIPHNNINENWRNINRSYNNQDLLNIENNIQNNFNHIFNNYLMNFNRNNNENNENNNNENNNINLGSTYPTNIFDTMTPNIFSTMPLNSDLTQEDNLNENVIIALTDKEFGEINKIEFKDIDSDSKCNICLGTYELSSNILKLKCGHTFDYDCAKNWLQNHSNKCPVCREEVSKGHPINL